ncbi:MAG TPA: ABC transporter permease subunit [Gaiellaceae bacterium]|nr:ABC transporter permease subunit [Gaiellaceae bacterium]
MTSAPTEAQTVVPRPSILARGIGFFSGTLGLAIKLVLLGAVNALAIWALAILVTEGKWVGALGIGAATLAIDAVYLVPDRRLVPLKYLVPGTVFLVAFVAIPIVSNVNIAFTNWSTLHNLSKDEAIAAVQERSLVAPADAATYTSTPARRDGTLVLLLVDDATGDLYVGSRDGLEPLAREDATLEGGVIVAAEGYEVVKGSDLFAIDEELAALVVPTDGDSFVKPEGLSIANEMQPTLVYDGAADTFTSIETGAVFSDDGEGAYVSASGETLEPGWRTHVGLENFRTILTDPLVRDPFVRVFIWTFAYAFISVLIQFAIGLFLAITLNKPDLRLRRIQRALLVLPFAVPAFLAVLVWQGLLNDEFGIVNQTLRTDIPWLFDANWAKVSCILVNVWIGFPYWFLVCTGALQAVPEELTEAARVDGAGGFQVFRKVTLPLLLVATAPLLIASFAFNFNLFNNIYFLTGGGPYELEQTVAGSTDILISYTYKIAFQAGGGAQYGLAAAVSIFIFFIVAGISAISFWRTRMLEEIR